MMNPSVTGLSFTNTLALERSLTNQIYLNGSGVAAGDVDGDGLTDLYLAGLDNSNRLFRNLGGWAFEDITHHAGVGCAEDACTGVALADLDRDFDLDLLVNTIGKGTRIFLNQGNARFKEVTQDGGLRRKTGAMSMALGDINMDGLLDVYVTNYRYDTFRDMPNTRFKLRIIDGKPGVYMVDGRLATEPDLLGRYSADLNGKIVEHGQTDVLAMNLGNGRFKVLPMNQGFFFNENGVELDHPLYDWGLSAMFRDVNMDGRPDLYVCNDFDEPDRFWLNKENGFHAVPPLTLRKMSRFSMGVDFADLDRDGLTDFMVVDMLSRDHERHQTQFAQVKPEPLPLGSVENRPQYVRNTLFRNRGDGTYSEIAHLAGVSATEWSWSLCFMDVDLDGFEDALITNGFARDAQNMDVARQLDAIKKSQRLSELEQLNLRRMFPSLKTANAAYRNPGNWRFDEKSDDWNFNLQAISQGMCLADLDNDGDQDVIINNLNDPVTLYRNNASGPRLSVRLQGGKSPTTGIGARIEVTGGPVFQSQEMISGGRYLSSDDPMRVFAASPEGGRLGIRVVWPSGRITLASELQPGFEYTLIEPESEAAKVVSTDPSRHKPPLPLFAADTRSPGWMHHENEFDDFARQPLLPWRLDRQGPGLSWIDINGDGWEDLVVGGAKGGLSAGFTNDHQGSLQLFSNRLLSQLNSRDQTGIVGFKPSESASMAWMAASSNYEDGLNLGGAVKSMNLELARPTDMLPGMSASAGHLAVSFMPDTKNWILFLGGRALPGKYPQPADSKIFVWTHDGWTEHPGSSRQLQESGNVTGAVFSDLDGDGMPELVVSFEWGSVRVFSISNNEVRAAENNGGLPELRGLWHGVISGDFNNDGKPDLVAGNLGRNTLYERYIPHGIRIYYGQWGGKPGTDIIEAIYVPEKSTWAPRRRLPALAEANAGLWNTFQSFADYAGADLKKVVGPRFNDLKYLTAEILDHVLFLNAGDHFQILPLPVMAQEFPVQGLTVADVDNDGNEDLFLCGNRFTFNPDEERLDSGTGLWLLGHGNGTFKCLSPTQSGVSIPGDMRSAAIADYNHDGRPDLAVSQNAGPVRLFANQSEIRGLRVVLNGPQDNPLGIGASVRVLFIDGKAGPAREIQAGGGYLSQSSPVPVLAVPKPSSAIEVKWPGGFVQNWSLTNPTMEEVHIPYAGR